MYTVWYGSTFYSLLGVSPLRKLCRHRILLRTFYSLLGVSGLSKKDVYRLLIDIFLLPFGSFFCIVARIDTRRPDGFLLPFGSFTSPRKILYTGCTWYDAAFFSLLGVSAYSIFSRYESLPYQFPAFYSLLGVSTKSSMNFFSSSHASRHFLLPFGSFLRSLELNGLLPAHAIFLLPFGSFTNQHISTARSHAPTVILSTPFWEFHNYHLYWIYIYSIYFCSFYSLLGVSGWCGKEGYRSKKCCWLSTPFWEFL